MTIGDKQQMSVDGQECLFLRLLARDDKATALSQSVAALRDGRAANPVAFAVDPASFAQVPGSPFAYWIRGKVRRLFKDLSSFESDQRTVKQGLATADDFRFIRCWWEIPSCKLIAAANGPNWRSNVTAFQGWCRKQTFEGKRWIPIAKGGAYAPFFDEPLMVVNWERDGDEMKRWTESLYDGTSWSRNIRNTDFYFRPGLTWPLRGIRLSAQAVPAGGCFSIAGKLAMSGEPDELYPLLGLMNSLAFDYLVGLFAGKVGGVQYEVGLIGKVPIPASIDDDQLAVLSREASKLAGFPATFDECRHHFVMPGLLAGLGTWLANRLSDHQFRLDAARDQLAERQAHLDDLAFRLYGIEPSDRSAMETPVLASGREAGGLNETGDEAELGGTAMAVTIGQSARDLLSYAVGCIVGRWDLRFGSAQKMIPQQPNPFDPRPSANNCGNGLWFVVRSLLRTMDAGRPRTET